MDAPPVKVTICPAGARAHSVSNSFPARWHTTARHLVAGRRHWWDEKGKMTGQRRGLNKERHSLLKAAFAGVAVAGFAAAWLGLASAHSSEADESAAAIAAAATPTPMRSPTAAATTGVTQATSTPAAPPEPANPEANLSKRSRGS